MKILGIDPALTALGWGVIEVNRPKIYYINSGVIKTTSNLSLHKRLAFISSSIEEIINIHQPAAIAMEQTFINSNARSSLKLGYVRGALMALIGKTNLPYYEFLPNKIKKNIVGSGHAEKEQIKHMIKIIISGEFADISYDESDALAIAYSCLVHTNDI